MGHCNVEVNMMKVASWVITVSSAWPSPSNVNRSGFRPQELTRLLYFAAQWARTSRTGRVPRERTDRWAFSVWKRGVKTTQEVVLSRDGGSWWRESGAGGRCASSRHSGTTSTTLCSAVSHHSTTTTRQLTLHFWLALTSWFLFLMPLLDRHVRAGRRAGEAVNGKGAEVAGVPGRNIRVWNHLQQQLHSWRRELKIWKRNTCFIFLKIRHNTGRFCCFVFLSRDESWLRVELE